MICRLVGFADGVRRRPNSLGECLQLVATPWRMRARHLASPEINAPGRVADHLDHRPT